MSGSTSYAALSGGGAARETPAATSSRPLAAAGDERPADGAAERNAACTSASASSNAKRFDTSAGSMGSADCAAEPVRIHPQGSMGAATWPSALCT